MAKKWTFEKTFKGNPVFDKVDPHMARFNPAIIKGVRGGLGPITIEPDMFPEDFELNAYDVTAKVEFSVTITRKSPAKKK